ncbi:type II toxin-antitoxin system RatA family toxin [Candidatus Liberibacter brunswickensis]|uniref:type II toxin-antitoxin system RatA family toxin n=1 Tax=Candidatus Liberibacter brunswickensis TaxID=1968796 RepID=UPI002FE10BA4
MHYFKDDRILNHSSKQMLNLVKDIEKYPEFVPLCKEIIIHDRSKEGNDEIIIASMQVSYAGIQKKFLTRVRINQIENIITVNHIKNIFNFLENHWIFEEICENKCKVHFSIKYELKNSLFDIMLKKVFHSSFLYFAKAFEDRARKIYRPLIPKE